MARPRDPMLEEFRLIAETRLDGPDDLDRLAAAICELFTEDCLLEDTSTTDVVRGRAELFEYCKALFGPYSNVRIEPREIIDAGTVSTMVLEISGDHTGELYGHAATGRRVSFPALAIYRCNDDCSQVRHESLAYDTGFIIAQVADAAGGLMAARGALLEGLDLRPVVGGEPYAASATLTVVDPTTAAPLVEVADVGPAGVAAAVAAARAAQRAWADLEPRGRAGALLRLADLLERRSELFAGVEALDVGKPIDLTPYEVASSVDKIRFFAGACRVLPGVAADGFRAPFQSHVRRDPVGVVAALAPWNYPLALAIWKVVPALAVGCTVVVKPSPETPLSTLLLGHLAAEVLPPGVLNVVSGGAATGEALVRHPDVAMVSLTGGTATGKAVMRAAADSLKRLHLELGGNAPVLVFDDADLGRLEDAYFMAAFRNTGQDCHAATRVYAPARLVEQVATTVQRVVDERVRIGDSLAPGVNVGPLVSAAQRERIGGLVERALAGGRIERLEARAPEVPANGFFLHPAVLVGARHEDEIVQQEIFGPVVTVTACDDEDEAIAHANGTAFGLAASVWTRDVDRALRVSRRLEVGTVWVNGHGGTVAEMPFGGVRESGFGRDLGTAALEGHTELKHIAIAVEGRRDG